MRENWGCRVCSLSRCGGAFTGVDTCRKRSVVHLECTQRIVCQFHLGKAVFEELTRLQWEGREEVFSNPRL